MCPNPEKKSSTPRHYIRLAIILMPIGFFLSYFPINDPEHPRAVATDEPKGLVLRCAGSAATGFIAGGIASIWTGPGVVPGVLLGGAAGTLICIGGTLWIIIWE
jgi:hypothetical protein